MSEKENLRKAINELNANIRNLSSSINVLTEQICDENSILIKTINSAKTEITLAIGNIVDN